MSDEQRIKQLLREGIEAARNNDRATARDRFEQVTELDENNERAWLYLAQMVDTDEERRVCLSNVLVINPDNEKARQQMNRLESKRRDEEAQSEVIPGVSRRQLLLIGGGGGAIVLLLLIIFLVSNSINASNSAATAQAQTAVAQLGTESASTAVAQQTFVFETQIAAVDTATPVPRAPTLPPTFTPSPEATVAGEEQLLPPPGPEVAGNIVAWGGVDVASNGARQLRLYSANGEGEFRLIGNENDLGMDVRFAGSSDRVIYNRYYAATFDFGLEAINTNGTQQQPIRTTGILEIGQPSYCSASNQVAFVGVPEERPNTENLQFDVEPPTQLFVLDMATNAVTRLTNDQIRYSYPAFSPDCTRIAVVRDDYNSAQAGADVIVLETTNPGSVTPITTDLSTYTESSPRWSPDGSQIIYAAAPETEPGNSDIVVSSATGAGTPQVPVRGPSDDILPVFSSDSAYLAFSSNRTGAYNIFIYRISDGQLFQLTNERNSVFVGGWWQ